MARIKSVLTAALLFVAAPTGAQTLANGEPLRFNYEYHCNGERMIVGHCRDNDPSSYCQLYYPDRTPVHPGYQVMKAEQLGQVLAKLNACWEAEKAAAIERLKATLAPHSASGTRAAEKALGPERATMRRLNPPGLGKQPWQLLNVNDEVGIFFTKAAINPSGSLPEGWFTEVFTDDQNIGPLSGVEFMQTRYRVNCADRTVAILQYAAYNLHAKLLKAESASSPEFTSVKPNSDQDQIFGFLCGTRKAKVTDPFVGDGIQLFGLYVELQKAREKK